MRNEDDDRAARSAFLEGTTRLPARPDTQEPVSLVDEVEAQEAAIRAEPSGFGMRWRDVEGDDKVELFVALRQWVDWFRVEYRLTGQELPPCWFMHTDILAELYAAWNAEYKAWSSGEPSNMPMTTWHYHVAVMRNRLSNKAAACVADGKHVERALAPFIVDEDLWEQTLRGCVTEISTGSNQ